MNKGYKLVNFCEFDKYAEKSYCAIHNVSPELNLGDITKVDETKLEPFTMVVGGSPCQDFSNAGKQKGSKWKCKCCSHEYNPLTVHWSERDKCPECGGEELDKTRSSLLVEWLRVIRSNKPKFGIYENVKNIVGKQFKDTTFKLFEEELHEYGYNTYWKILDAKNYGVPQHRERVYLILVNRDLDNGKFRFPDPMHSDVRIRDLLENNVEEKYYIDISKLGIINERFFRQAKETFESNNCECGDTIDAFNKRVNKSGYCPTLTTRPEGFKTAILPVVMDTPQITSNGTVDCDECNHRSEVCLCDISKDEDPCPLIVRVRQATKKGYIECEVGGVADLSYPNSKTRRGRVQDNGDTSPTITAIETGVCRIENHMRVRKLIPLECFRLMGFDDCDFYAAKNVGISDSQLYKQAGNSIVVEVLHRILVELYIAMPYLFDNLTLSSYFSGIGAFEKALDLLYEDIESGNFTIPSAE